VAEPDGGAIRFLRALLRTLLRTGRQNTFSVS
jgi:hypothetical protein